MGNNGSLLAYDDVRELLDRAIASQNGIAVTVESYGQAVRLRQRIYAFRKLMQKQSLQVYTVGDPMYGRSVYDGLTVPQFERIKGVPEVELTIKKTEMQALQVREL